MYTIKILDKKQTLIENVSLETMEQVVVYLKENYDPQSQRIYITKNAGL
jgi:hypothetical protein